MLGKILSFSFLFFIKKCMGQERNEKNSELQDVRDRFQRKAYRMMIEVGFIFGIPAFLAYQGGKVLERRYETGGNILLVSLVAAFLFSWIIIVVKYRQMQKEARAFDAAYRQMRQHNAKKQRQEDNAEES